MEKFHIVTAEVINFVGFTITSSGEEERVLPLVI